MAKIITVATAMGRLAFRGASNSRLLRAGYSGVRTTMRSAGRLGRILWLQITGVFFCLFALTFAARLPRMYSEYNSGSAPRSNLLLLAGMTVLFAWFGLSSFWKAKKK